MQQNNFIHLLEDPSFLHYCLSTNETDVLIWEKWLAVHPEDQQEIREIKTMVILLAEESGRKQAEASFEKLSKRLNISHPSDLERRGMVFSLIKKIAVAASLLLVLAAGLYLYFSKNDNTVRSAVNKKEDIKPGGNKATLTLANGTKIDLTNAKNGMLVQQARFKISKKYDGQVVYQATGFKAGQPDVSTINTIETPVKGQYMIVLPDGTKVWLNSLSSLQYPAVFDKNTRAVQLKGEAYFEVAHVTINGTHKRLPFIVKTISSNPNKEQTIEVLGTHFNINSYDDEPLTKTTLLEGSIKAMNSNPAVRHEVLVKPGEEIATGATQFNVSRADVEAAVAWKNDDFVFREDIRSALRKVARWYDVDVIYAESAPDQLMLGGWISRKKNISEVLEMMEATGKVHFKVTGRRIMVTE